MIFYLLIVLWFIVIWKYNSKLDLLFPSIITIIYLFTNKHMFIDDDNVDEDIRLMENNRHDYADSPIGKAFEYGGI